MGSRRSKFEKVSRMHLRHILSQRSFASFGLLLHMSLFTMCRRGWCSSPVFTRTIITLTAGLSEEVTPLEPLVLGSLLEHLQCTAS